MRLSPAGRKLALTAHVTASVGWLGAVLCFLALSIVGIVHDDPSTVRAVYLAMASMGRWVLVPLSVASLATGLLQAVGTRWGLLRHYWVVIKLVMNVAATAVLLLYLQTLDGLADIASDSAAPLDHLRSPSPVIHAAGALILLLIAVVLSVYKPVGLTKRGRRQRDVRD
jgi:hypothetical protein